MILAAVNVLGPTEPDRVGHLRWRSLRSSFRWPSPDACGLVSDRVLTLTVETPILWLTATADR